MAEPTVAAPPAERARARVDLGAVEANCALLKRRLGEAALCAVVKAEGYGHGAVACAKAAQAGGAEWLAVATAREAAELREGKIGGRLLVMGALTPDEVEIALGADADVVAWSSEFLRLAAAKALAVGRTAPVHVKLDTGMGRLGTKDPAEALELLAGAAEHELLQAAGLMTHFATADDSSPAFMNEQLARFAPVAAEAKRALPGIIVHAANSAATLAEPDTHFEMARCGVAIYGLDPFQRDPRDHGLEPALSLESYVAAVKRFEPGESVGYGRTWTAAAATHVGVVPIGYGDGYRRALSNSADVLIRGRRHPLVGTVSMDNITVDLGSATDVVPGEQVTLIGGQGGERVPAEELARTLGTINYEVTCGLTGRVPRRYDT
jgi:alanine racemase